MSYKQWLSSLHTGHFFFFTFRPPGGMVPQSHLSKLSCPRLFFFPDCSKSSVSSWSPIPSHISKYFLVCLPAFLLPWRFQGKAFLVMLSRGLISVWLSHLHLLSSCSTGSCLALSHRSLLVVLSDHCSLKIVRKHLFINTCILLHWAHP
jgi:hypothetical protein